MVVIATQKLSRENVTGLVGDTSSQIERFGPELEGAVEEAVGDRLGFHRVLDPGGEQCHLRALSALGRTAVAALDSLKGLAAPGVEPVEQVLRDADARVVVADPLQPRVPPPTPPGAPRPGGSPP